MQREYNLVRATVCRPLFALRGRAILRDHRMTSRQSHCFAHDTSSTAGRDVSRKGNALGTLAFLSPSSPTGEAEEGMHAPPFFYFFAISS